MHQLQYSGGDVAAHGVSQLTMSPKSSMQNVVVFHMVVYDLTKLEMGDEENLTALGFATVALQQVVARFPPTIQSTVATAAAAAAAATLPEVLAAAAPSDVAATLPSDAALPEFEADDVAILCVSAALPAAVSLAILHGSAALPESSADVAAILPVTAALPESSAHVAAIHPVTAAPAALPPAASHGALSNETGAAATLPATAAPAALPPAASHGALSNETGTAATLPVTAAPAAAACYGSCRGSPSGVSAYVGACA
ncbi:hypothetical protein EJB05_07300 [Eragrostis curvula]|uniref:Uncharacterized protein n=1 Tax=Eragrostis curvula TaxID=38414 RepID=A0A5J9WI04_9POAL|nr:hypothetical protein EJB05_07300 [Eragrostis curvula]